jgi:hypothetical protein
MPMLLVDLLPTEADSLCFKPHSHHPCVHNQARAIAPALLTATATSNCLADRESPRKALQFSGWELECGQLLALGESFEIRDIAPEMEPRVLALTTQQGWSKEHQTLPAVPVVSEQAKVLGLLALRLRSQPLPDRLRQYRF